MKNNTLILSSLMGIIFFILCCSPNANSSGSFEIVELKKVEKQHIQDLVRKELDKGKIPLLYFSASYCPPCKKIEKALEDSTRFEDLGQFTVFEIKESNTAGGAGHPFWQKYNIRSIPRIYKVDRNLEVLNQATSREWKPSDRELEAFMEAFWPGKTQEELDEEEAYRTMSRNQNRQRGAFLGDPELSETTKISLREEFYEKELKALKRNGKTVKSIAALQALVDDGSFQDLKALTIQIHGEESAIENQKAFDVLKKFISLEYLNLNGTHFFPTSIYELTNLKALIVSGLRFEYEHSNRLAQLKHLEYIDHSFTSILFPDNMHQLSKLKHIKYYVNKLEQPKQLYQLPALETLNMDVVNESDLEGINQLKQLKFLRTNKLHPDIGQLINLKALKVAAFSDDFPGTFKNLQNLEVLYLSGSTLEEPPEFISHLKNLKALYLFEWGNLKNIPDSYNNIEKLKYLYLSFVNQKPDFDIPEKLTKPPVSYVVYVRR